VYPTGFYLKENLFYLRWFKTKLFVVFSAMFVIVTEAVEILSSHTSLNVLCYPHREAYRLFICILIGKGALVLVMCEKFLFSDIELMN
jgi:hypothetical protein